MPRRALLPQTLPPSASGPVLSDSCLEGPIGSANATSGVRPAASPASNARAPVLVSALGTALPPPLAAYKRSGDSRGGTRGTVLEQKINETSGRRPHALRHGWWRRVVAGLRAARVRRGAVPAFPQLLSRPSSGCTTRCTSYPADQGVIGAAIALGVANGLLRRRRSWVDGDGLRVGATLLGGPASRSTRRSTRARHRARLVRARLLLMTLIFSPLEVIWPAYRSRASSGRSGCWTSGTSCPPISDPATSFLICCLRPSSPHPANARAQAAMASLPWLVQFSSRCWGGPRRYSSTGVPHGAVHVALPRNPHSSKALDWLRLSRASRGGRGGARGMLVPRCSCSARTSSWPICSS